MTEPSWMIYGATGYTGRLIAQQAVERGLRPILAGRNEPAITALAAELDLEARVVSLVDATALSEALQDVTAVLHCAGPFMHTWRPMVEACLATRTHYLDITGEISVFESIHSLHQSATDRKIVMLPGVGFDVVPSDCLAKLLTEALPDATDLKLAFTTSGGGTSRGTRRTMVEGLPSGGAIRRDGKIVQVPFAHSVETIPFSCGSRHAMTVGWGDVSTAYHSTGIPNIRVYTGIPEPTLRRIRRFMKFAPILSNRFAQRLIHSWIDLTAPGPSLEQRERARSYFWGEVSNLGGEAATATMQIPEGYTFTAVAAVESLRRVLHESVAPGFATPSIAFGSEFASSLPGVQVSEVKLGELESE